jgi:flagellar protein FliL
MERKRGGELSAVTVLSRAGIVALVAIAQLGCNKGQSAEAASKDSKIPKITSVMHLEPFVVNLADQEDNRFLRIGVDLGLESATPAKEAKGEGAVPTARIRDCLLGVLSSWHSDALLAPGGQEKLKDELLKALQARVPELSVGEVYFTDFLVQR